MAIEIIIPTTRTLGGATRALLEVITGPGFHNIDAPETAEIEVELMKVRHGGLAPARADAGLNRRAG